MIAICLYSNTKSQCWSVTAVLCRILVSIFAFTAIYLWPIFPLHLLVPVLAHGSNFVYFAVVCTFASSPCIQLYILCIGLYFCLLAIHIAIPSLQYSALQYSFGTVIRFLVPVRIHIFCLAFFVNNHFEFLFQSFWNLSFFILKLT